MISVAPWVIVLAKTENCFEILPFAGAEQIKTPGDGVALVRGQIARTASEDIETAIESRAALRRKHIAARAASSIANGVIPLALPGRSGIDRIDILDDAMAHSDSETKSNTRRS